jgi:hypothetical protein
MTIPEWSLKEKKMDDRSCNLKRLVFWKASWQLMLRVPPLTVDREMKLDKGLAVGFPAKYRHPGTRLPGARP